MYSEYKANVSVFLEGCATKEVEIKMASTTFSSIFTHQMSKIFEK